ncbi:MAG TPA: type IV pilus secretin PilQ [Candidatus Binatia bacterium]
MMKIAHIVKRLLTDRLEKVTIPGWSLSAACLGIALAPAMFGCTPAVMNGDMKNPAAVAQTPAASTSQQATGQQNESGKVQDLSVREESGQTILTIKLAMGIAQYRHFPLPQPTRILLDVFNDARPSETETYRIASTLVSHLKVSSGDGYTRMTLEIMAGAVPPYVVTPEDGGVKIVIGGADPKIAAKRSFDLVKGGKQVDQTVTAAGVTAMAAEVGGTARVEARGPKSYTGQKLSLDFKDADIKNVFRLLAEVSGLNIVVTNDVNRKVTLRLVDVPWDQALDLLIDTNGLGKEQMGNVVRISTAGQLKTERDALFAARKSEETLEPLHTVYFNINYAKAKDLEPKIKTLLSKRPDASLVTDERSNMIMVRDIKKAVDDATILIARLDARTPQVLIESNLIETTPSFARALGNRLTFGLGGTTFSSGAGAGVPFAGSTSSFPSFATGLGATVGIIQNKFFGIHSLANALEAAENEGNIRIISRPSVVTLNNQASTIRSERILRISLPSSTNIATGSGSSAAGAAVATEKIPVGIILTVTPQVSSDGFVLLNITVKSSSIANSPTVSQGSTVIPFDELNREANASVLVRDGETIVLGGILKDTRQESESGVPYLKDVPIFGWLFKNHRWQKDFEELMVFITPRVTNSGSMNLPLAEQLWRDQMRKTDGNELPPPPAKL